MNSLLKKLESIQCILKIDFFGINPEIVGRVFEYCTEGNSQQILFPQIEFGLLGASVGDIGKNDLGTGSRILWVLDFYIRAPEQLLPGQNHINGFVLQAKYTGPLNHRGRHWCH